MFHRLLVYKLTFTKYINNIWCIYNTCILSENIQALETDRKVSHVHAFLTCSGESTNQFYFLQQPMYIMCILQCLNIKTTAKFYCKRTERMSLFSLVLNYQWFLMVLWLPLDTNKHGITEILLKVLKVEYKVVK